MMICYFYQDNYVLFYAHVDTAGCPPKSSLLFFLKPCLDCMSLPSLQTGVALCPWQVRLSSVPWKVYRVSHAAPGGQGLRAEADRGQVTSSSFPSPGAESEHSHHPAPITQVPTAP